MKPLLLDSCAVLWWAREPERLGRDARHHIAAAHSRVIVSAVCTVELAIKAKLGRLPLPGTAQAFVERVARENRFELMAIEHRHAGALEHLPRVHQDPFDRMLVATAIVEGFAIVTNDAMIARYPVEIVW